MARLPIVRINGTDYISDARLEEFRAVKDPHTRISWAQVDSAPEAYVFGSGPPALADRVPPLCVRYIKREDGSMQLEFTPATDGRPNFHELPLAVRCLARLRYWMTYPDHHQKLRVAGISLLARDAVRNDILYKCALDAALDPAIDSHRDYIVDVRKDRDDFSLRGVVPFDPALMDEMLTKDTVMSRFVYIHNDGGPVPRLHVVEGNTYRPRFADYPLAVRLEARLRFLWHPTPQENRMLYASYKLPVSSQRVIWDEVMCRRADEVMRRERKAARDQVPHTLPAMNRPPVQKRRRKRGR